MQAPNHLILLKRLVIRSTSRGLWLSCNVRQLDRAPHFKLEDVFQPVVICHWMLFKKACWWWLEAGWDLGMKQTVLWAKFSFLCVFF